MTEIYKTYYQSEVGVLEITGTEEGLLSILYVEEGVNPTQDKLADVPECLHEAIKQLDEYFQGIRREFTIKVLLGGTEFQNKVWKKLLEISYGTTWSYKELAIGIGNENAQRAVGNANSKNRINIIVPCHRVIGSKGKLTGYGGGLWRKKWLLNHEQKFGEKK